MPEQAAPTVVARRRVFFGWWVVTAIFVMLAVSSGLGFYNLSVVLEALTSERGFSVAAVSSTTAFCFVVSGIAGLGIARLLDRWDPRLVVGISSVIAALALLFLGRVATLTELYLAYLVFGIGFAGTSLLPGTTIVTRWFSRRRGLALALAMTGLSAGGAVITPLSARLIASRGLAGASPWLAGAYILGILPIAALLLRPRPESMGLHPDGDLLPPPPAPPAAHPDVSSAIRSRFFLLVTAAYTFAMVAQVGGITHLFKLVGDRAGAAVAATAVSMVAGGSICGRLAGGWIMSRVRLRPFSVVMLLVQGFTLGALAIASSAPSLLVSSVAFGLTLGNVLLLQSLLMAEAFGTLLYARVYSIGSLLATAGVAGGPVLLGLLHDVADYRLAFLGALAASWIAALLMWIAGRDG
ncbi:MAG TPA: MFS transporter [Thermoanaerobaculia bacterium]|nr:MFS transporter [Thermoanaerobaculia bacterium]